MYFILGAFILLAIYSLFFGPFEQKPQEKVDISKVVNQVKADEVEKIVKEDGNLTVNLKNGKKETAVIGKDESLVKDYGIDPTKVAIEVKEAKDSALVVTLLAAFLPVVLIIAFFYFMMRQAAGGANQALSFGRSKPKVFDAQKQKITFQDVAGVHEAKQELTEVVEFLKHPKKFLALGARIPKGVLLVGPPGSGKTLLAKAVAGEAGVPFFSISGSEFVEMFVGVGASRVRDLFNRAKKNSPCIIFVDEIDAVGRQRGAGLGGSHDEREQTLNQILVEMDGFDTDTNVIVMAATNRPDILDPALLRPGRFDRRVVLEMPDAKDREDILKVHARGKPLESGVDLSKTARTTPGFTGADLQNLVNEAAILAARNDRKKIKQQDFTESIEKVLLGPERKSKLLNAEEKKITAYHEAGHALVAKILPNCDPIHKISIISRGMAAGYTWTMPETDRRMYTKSKFQDDLAQFLGGRAAEALVFDEISTGAESDLRQATRIARKMVTDYGMSEKLGPRTYGEKEELVFLGRELGEHKNYSEEVAAKIDEEVNRFINEAYERAKDVLAQHKKKLVEIAEKLMKEETIEGGEFEKLFSKTAGKQKRAKEK